MFILKKLVGKAGAYLQGSSRQVLIVSGGTAAGQAIALLAAPVVTRLYSPSDFGLFAICSAIVITLGTVSTFRFELAVCLPHSEQEAHGLATLGLGCAILFSASLTVTIVAAGSYFANVLGNPALRPLLWFVPGSVLAMSCYLVLNQLAIRHGRFKSIGKRNFLQQLATVGTQVALGAASIRPAGLIAGFGLGQLVSATSLLPGSRILSRSARMTGGWSALRSLAWRYRRFPLILGPAGLLNVLGLQLPVVLIAYWFGSPAAGWLGLTQRVLAIPVALIGTAVGQVYLARLSAALRSDPEGAIAIFRRVSLNLAVCAIVLLILLVALGPWIFPLVFGPAWLNSGTYAQAMAFALALQLIAAPLSLTLIALERQRTQLAWDFGRLAVVFVTVAVTHHVGATALSAIWALGFALAATYSLSWLLSMLSLRNHVQNRRN